MLRSVVDAASDDRACGIQIDRDVSGDLARLGAGRSHRGA
jgi:hypothetical protein